jgi:hypothetical protein
MTKARALFEQLVALGFPCEYQVHSTGSEVVRIAGEFYHESPRFLFQDGEATRFVCSERDEIMATQKRT